jgi:hypothetical protein
MSDFEGQVLGDLNVLKSQMQQIMGIGQPGRLTGLEQRVGSNEEAIQKMKGFVTAIGMALTIIHLAISYFDARHH